jgi:glucose-6-phosphate 1-dehydrogenase
VAVVSALIDRVQSSRQREAVGDPPPEPLIFVIFGATGDLAHRKLLPALYKLAAGSRLPDEFAVVGMARREKDEDDYRAEMRDAVTKFTEGAVADDVLDTFVNKLHFCVGQFQDPKSYVGLKAELDHLKKDLGTLGNVLYYLATPPEFDQSIVENLSQAGLLTHHGNHAPWTRVIFEKPFGRDYDSARELNRAIQKHLREDQIYRIDHYLGKETVQNIMAVRFANGILEPLWNRNYVDNIQITAAESIGVENRASYYENAGALRDMIQSHLLQVLSLIAMEPPVSWSSKAIHDEKVKVLQAMDRITGDQVDTETVRGQYGPGWIDGQPVPGYREEPGVPPDSTADTFAAVKLHVESWRWGGVPIYLRTGKRLPHRATEISLTFKEPPQMLFRQVSAPIQADVLTMRIQPDEGVTLILNSKIPGAGFRVQPVRLDFEYDETFTDAVPEAYERLLLDAMRGDSTLFTRTDEVEEGWDVIQGILDRWSETSPEFPNYSAGSWGPYEATKLIEAGSRRWRNPGVGLKTG